MPYEFVPLWTGFYIGGSAGAAMGATGIHDKFDYVGDPSYSGTASNIGLIGGLQTGYNYQYGHFLFGLEGDAGYLGLSASKSAKGLSSADKTGHCYATYKDTYWWGSDTYTLPYSGGMCKADASYTGSSELYGDLTARFGYLMGRTLLYAKGGAAVLNADFKASYSGGNCLTTGDCSPVSGTKIGPSTFNFDHNNLMVGWTAGAGVEYALSSSWSLKAEYQHFDFGKMSYSYNGCYAIGPNSGMPSGGTCPSVKSQYDNHYTSTLTNGKTDVSVTADAVKFGINYHFSDEAELR